MAELGLMGVCIPEQYGGAGFDYISLGLVCEELEACDTFLRVAMSVHVGLNSLSVYSWGTEEQKAKISCPTGKGRKARHLWPDRAERRFGRRGNAFHRPPRR
jgi:glutaryl-CoA dehydrogenase (non-decarboxylating)